MSFIINPYRFGAAAVNQGPDFANVVLLLGFNGSNGSTTITDESSFTRPGLACVGNAQLSTAQKKFGTASLLLDGSGDAVTAPFYTLDKDSLSGGIGSTDDFQIEAWIRFASGANLGVTHDIVTHYDATGNKRVFLFRYQSSGLLQFLSSPDGLGTLTTGASGAWSPSTQTWYHVAFSRVSGTGRVFVDGSKINERSYSEGAFSASSAFRIGGHETSGSIQDSFNGNIDEVRCAVYEGGGGAGKLYTADFTPPSAAFPRS